MLMKTTWSAGRLALTLLATLFFTEAGAQQPVFPGAEGFGVNTPAGRGGHIFYVTSLADNGPGTLREAISHSLPRRIVFESGVQRQSRCCSSRHVVAPNVDAASLKVLRHNLSPIPRYGRLENAPLRLADCSFDFAESTDPHELLRPLRDAVDERTGA